MSTQRSTQRSSLIAAAVTLALSGRRQPGPGSTIDERGPDRRGRRHRHPRQPARIAGDQARGECRRRRAERRRRRQIPEQECRRGDDAGARRRHRPPLRPRRARQHRRHRSQPQPDLPRRPPGGAVDLAVRRAAQPRLRPDPDRVGDHRPHRDLQVARSAPARRQPRRHRAHAHAPAAGSGRQHRSPPPSPTTTTTRPRRGSRASPGCTAGRTPTKRGASRSPRSTTRNRSIARASEIFGYTPASTFTERDRRRPRCAGAQLRQRRLVPADAQARQRRRSICN